MFKPNFDWFSALSEKHSKMGDFLFSVSDLRVSAGGLAAGQPSTGACTVQYLKRNNKKIFGLILEKDINEGTT